MTDTGHSSPSPIKTGHDAHQGAVELKHWRPDPDWYSPIICETTARLSKLVLGKLNNLSFEGIERWNQLFSEETIAQRKTDQRGLLSFSNHVSLFDDPLLLANLGETRFERARWIAADHLNFFGSRLKGIIFSSGKCVPIIRGAGLQQPGFDYLIQRLRLGEWVHIFPEGGRSREVDHCLQLPLKVGIGKLICEAKPILMPFYHYGMQDVLPIGKRLPRLNQRVRVHFGEATVVRDEWWAHLLGQATDQSVLHPKELWTLATQWARDELLKIERRVHPKYADR